MAVVVSINNGLGVTTLITQSEYDTSGNVQQYPQHARHPLQRYQGGGSAEQRLYNYSIAIGHVIKLL